MKSHVVIGNSGAGISAALAIRGVSESDEVIIISAEPCRAYSPVLETHYLAGHISYNDMFFVDEGFYRRHNLLTILGQKAESIDIDKMRLYLETGESVCFDTLLLATGASSIVPPIRGVDGPGVFTLRTADDAQRIDEWVSRWGLGARDSRPGDWRLLSGRAVIVGAGLIGMQAVDALVERGLAVVVVEMLDHVLPLVLDSGGAVVVERALRARDVDLRLGDSVQQIEDIDGRKVISLKSGDRIEADLVIMATGVRPNLGLAKTCGLRINGGVVVDAHARTSVENIFAAGDVAEGPDSIYGEHQINATWFNAIEQGRVAGLNMVGVHTRYDRNVRTNISFPLGIPLASVGLTTRRDDQQEEFVSESNGHYRKLIFDGERLVGAVLVGDVEEIGLLGAAIKNPHGLNWSKRELVCSNGLTCFARGFFPRSRIPLRRQESVAKPI
ncbi:MAG: NAD(P)/FAD-dependent oxidoreductase [Chloroflexota bacterium]